VANVCFGELGVTSVFSELGPDGDIDLERIV
jgi:hypothetical protein